MEHVQSPSLIPHSPRVQWASSLLYGISIICGSQWRCPPFLYFTEATVWSFWRPCLHQDWNNSLRKKNRTVCKQILGCSVPYRLIAAWPAWVIEKPRGLAGGPTARRFHGYIWGTVQDGSQPHWWPEGYRLSVTKAQLLAM